MKKHLLNFKTLILSLVLMCFFGYANAATEVINGVNTGTKDVDLVGTAFTLPGTYIAGNSSTLKYDGNNTIKIRCSKSATIADATSANTFVINVNEGYKILRIEATAISNYDAGVEISHIYVDNTETDLGTWSVAGKAGSASSISFSGFEAKKAIYFVTDAGATQILFAATITYEETIQTAATPSISIVDGTVTITTNEAGATTYYTTDGSVPTTTSAVYTEPFTVTEGTMVKAYSVKDGMKDSKIASETYSSFAPITAVFGLTRQIASESTTSSDGKVSGYALAADEVVDPAVEQVSIVSSYPTSLSGLTDKGRNVYHGSTKCYVDKGVTNYRNTTKTLGDDYYQFDLTIADGYQLSLTQLVSDICKDSDKSQYQVVILQNGIAVYTGSTVSVNKTADAKKTVDLSGEDALQSLQGTVSVKMLWTNTGNTGKYIALKDLNVTGVISKAPIVTTYAVNVTVNPAEAGTVAQNGTNFAAGKDVILTATPNVGYEFSHWTDSEGTSVSTNTTYEFSMPAEDLSFTAHFNKLPLVTYSIAGMDGVEGVVPTQENAKSITIPTNKTLYLEGHTLTGWTDGNTTYDLGTIVSVTNDVTLTPVFTENTVSLADRTSAITLKWGLGPSLGAPVFALQGDKGIYVIQAVVAGETIDVKMDIDASSGKVNNENRSDTWAQVNSGAKFTIPAEAGAVISFESYEATTTTTINGNVIDQGSKVPVYIPLSDGTTAEIIFGDGRYLSYVQVVLPTTPIAIGAVEAEVEQADITSYNKCVITKDGQLIDSSYDGSYITFNVKPEDSGVYTFTSKIATKLDDIAMTLGYLGEDNAYAESSKYNVTNNGSWTSPSEYVWSFALEAGKVYTFKMLGHAGSSYCVNVFDMRIVNNANVTIGSNGYSTFYSDQVVAIPDGVTVYTASLSDDASYLTLTEVNEDYLPAHTGVVLKGEEGAICNFVYSNETVEAVASDLSGVAVRTAASNFSGTIYALATIDSETAFYQYTGSYIPANKAFLVIPAAAAAPKVRIAGAVTGIESVTVSQDAATGIYNLSGQRVKEMTAPGLYIVGGKKVLVK